MNIPSYGVARRLARSRQSRPRSGKTGRPRTTGPVCANGENGRRGRPGTVARGQIRQKPEKPRGAGCEGTDWKKSRRTFSRPGTQRGDAIARERSFRESRRLSQRHRRSSPESRRLSCLEKVPSRNPLHPLGDARTDRVREGGDRRVRSRRGDVRRRGGGAGDRPGAARVPLRRPALGPEVIGVVTGRTGLPGMDRSVRAAALQGPVAGDPWAREARAHRRRPPPGLRRTRASSDRSRSGNRSGHR